MFQAVNVINNINPITVTTKSDSTSTFGLNIFHLFIKNLLEVVRYKPWKYNFLSYCENSSNYKVKHMLSMFFLQTNFLIQSIY